MTATDTARSLLTQLIANGLTDLVIAPGSRNGPISLAALDAQDSGQLRVHTRVDERSAGFFALGIALLTKQPVAVVVTSGTAGAHLLPAMIEAAENDSPLIAITADRPVKLVNTGANQTVEQLNFFAAATKRVLDLDSEQDAPSWQTSLTKFLADGVYGPIHLNARFKEPLLPTNSWKPRLKKFRVPLQPVNKLVAGSILNGKKGVVIAGHGDSGHAAKIAAKLNWPIFAEPSSMCVSPNLIAHAPLTILSMAQEVEVVVTTGRAGLSRGINQLLSSKKVVSVNLPTRISNPAAILHSTGELELTDLEQFDSSWLDKWLNQGQKVSRLVQDTLTNAPLSALHVTNLLNNSLTQNDQIHLAASLSLRDFDYTLHGCVAGSITANRGVNGIDGIISSSLGAASIWNQSAQHQSYALLGDIALVHDLSSLVIPSTDVVPQLRLIVSSNNGGGVFSTIEQNGVAGFEQVFGTPHDLVIAEVLQALGIKTTVIKNKSELELVLQTPALISAAVIEGLDRAVEAKLRAELVAAAKSMR